MARIENVSDRTIGTFFRCLHDERPDDPDVTAIRRRWFDTHVELGLRAKVLITDADEVAGLCQYIPIEHSHYLGRDLMAILCMWVHGYEHHLGNRQGQGYGRMMLEEIEGDSRDCGCKGVVVWGKDFPYWNPISFYLHMGYEKVDQTGNDVFAWKPFTKDAEPPRFLRRRKTGPRHADRVTIVSLFTGWCGGCGFNLEARKAAEELGEAVDFIEVDTSDRENMLEWGISSDILIDGESYRPDGPPFTSEDIREHVLNLLKEKTGRAGED
jgi:GNAT superfamily N-acetyltransferase